VLGDPTGAVRESFAAGRLDYPQYTRPAEFRGHRVPEVLLSGDHGRIAEWRRREAFRRTLVRRPDLLETVPPTREEREWLDEMTRRGELTRTGE
jgi:tRNA (guanine37-N1)-methyltransferase